MSRNGSGTYSLPAGNPVVTGTTIASTWANNTMNDLASAMTDSVAADGQTAMTGNLNLNSNKIVNVADPTLAQDAATKNYSDTTYLAKASNLSDVANATTSRTNISAAKSGANSDITSLTGLTTPLSQAQGGTGTTTGYYGFKNRIINGGFNIAQRGTSFVSGANDNDTYNLDRWYVLSDGNDAVDITQATTVPTGAKFSIGLDVETANKKFGIAQIIENANCFDAIGGAVTLSFQAKVSSTTKLDNIKCAIVAWSGTADSVTSDIISAWGVEGTNPTLIANATYENTPANLNVTTSFATYSVTANVDTASTSNIIVFIWSDVTDTTAGDFLYVTNIQLEKGSTATSFDYRPYGTELALCQRYYWQQGGSPYTRFAGGIAIGRSSTVATSMAIPPVTMRVFPTILSTNIGNTTINGTAISSISVDSDTNFGPIRVVANLSGLTTGTSYEWESNNNSTTRVAYSSEL